MPISVMKKIRNYGKETLIEPSSGSGANHFTDFVLKKKSVSQLRTNVPFYIVAPPGNQAAIRENKSQPVVLGETGLLDSKSLG